MVMLLATQSLGAKLEMAQSPLSSGAIEISPDHSSSFNQLEKKSFELLWKTRFEAERHLAGSGNKNRLCYSKLKSDSSPKWQLVTYSSLPWFLDNFILRKIYSIWKQAVVLFRTSFPASAPSEKEMKKMREFWQTPAKQQGEEGVIEKSGSGALIIKGVVKKQLVYPETPSEDKNEIRLLYNYIPLRTGGEQMHFLLVPTPSNPARNFLELDKEQYVEVLSLTQKVAFWARKQFGEDATIHFFDKTGKIAGQTQPLYHAHLIIVKEDKEEVWGKLAMFFRMLVPTWPLSDDELKKRVTHYRGTLGRYLASQLASQGFVSKHRQSLERE